MTPEQLKQLIPHEHVLRFDVLEWDYNYKLEARRIPVTKTGQFIKELNGKALLLLSDESEIWVEAERVEVVPKFAEF